MTAVARLARIPGLWLWLPVVLIPPVLVMDAAMRGEKEVTALGVLCAFVGCLPLLVRRRLPFAVMGPLLTGGIILVLWQLEPGDTVVLIAAVALAELAAHRDRRYAIGVAVAVVPCVIVSVVPFAEDASEAFSIILRNVLLCAVAVAVGDAVRSRGEAVERAAAVSEEEALRRMGEERLRIARDVHDVVAHTMVAINVQAGVAAHLIDQDPEQARAALRDIKATSGEALADLRGTLGVLRDPDAAAPTAPSGDLGRLEELAAGLRAAGVAVRLDVAELDGVPAAVHAAGYRIVQEALTNVLRHARATEVLVRVRAGDDVAILVEDDGTGAGEDGGSGNGIRGMRERTGALGGTVDAGPRPEGGWRVEVRLPLRAGSIA